MQYLVGTHHPQEALLPRVMWCAEDDHLPVGYIAGHLTKRLGCDGELQWIYVVPHYRGRAIACQFLRLLGEWFVNQRAIRICVNAGTEQARSFYRRHGAVDLNKHWLVWSDIHVVL